MLAGIQPISSNSQLQRCLRLQCRANHNPGRIGSMRLFEILMLLLILPALLWPLLPWRRPRWVDYLPAAALVAMVLQLFIEGYRWQMIPAYGLVTVVFVLGLVRLWRPVAGEKKRTAATVAASVAGLIIWLLAFALPYLLPVPQLPDTTGPYAIGTQTFHLVDEAREEIYTADPADKREIMFQVWYPADANANGERALYIDDLQLMGEALADRLDLPPLPLDYIDLVALDVKRNVPLLVEDAPFPVLVFSHGLRGIREQNTAMVRELVSHGFVVATIDHTYGNVMTVFPDGRIAFYNPNVLSETGEPSHTSNLLVNVWAEDIGSVLDQLTEWNETEGHAFSSSLDLTRVGVFGHSTGGGAAVEFCGQDSRCKAGVGLDAWLGPVSEEIVGQGLDQPFLFLRANEWDFSNSGENFDIADELLANAQETTYVATVKGASHFDFTDVPLFSPLTAQLGLSGEMNGTYVVEMMDHMTTVFFLQELQNEGEDRVLAAMVYPEMSIIGNGR